jgi:hypothetical protein
MAAGREAVALKTMRPYQSGQEVLLNDSRPNGERILAIGTLQDENLSDYLLYETALVPTDRLYTAKREVLLAQGMEARTMAPAFNYLQHWNGAVRSHG